MMNASALPLLAAAVLTLLLPDSHSFVGGTRKADPRNIINGHAIPKEGYCDQPYVVVTNDGNWLCLLTTGPGGRIAKVPACGGHDQRGPGQDLVETDRHRAGQRAGLAICLVVVPLVTPGGRVYAFYDYDGDGKVQATWDCDPGLLKTKSIHHLSIIVDGGPRIITFLVDGRLCDGGSGRATAGADSTKPWRTSTAAGSRSSRR